jgi:AraC-like DNA-binding protein
MGQRATPLASHAVLRTTDIEEARASVAASLAPHRLTQLGAGRFQVVHNAAQLGRLGIHYIDYGAESEVRVDALGFHLIQIPLAGSTRLTTGGREIVASPKVAALTGAGSVRMRYSAGNARLMVQVAPHLLRERLAVARRVGLVVPSPAGATLDLTRGPGRTWRSLLDVVISDLERDASLAGAPLAVSSFELTVLDGFIATMADQGADPRPERTPRQRLIIRAARLIDDHCAEPLGTPDIAEAIGLSVRALQAGFREHFDTTPMGYLRRARLERMREALRDGSAASVTEAATRWGLTHLGRVSSDYRATFGEMPSETLQRSR